MSLAILDRWADAAAMTSRGGPERVRGSGRSGAWPNDFENLHDSCFGPGLPAQLTKQSTPVISAKKTALKCTWPMLFFQAMRAHPSPTVQQTSAETRCRAWLQWNFWTKSWHPPQHLDLEQLKCHGFCPRDTVQQQRATGSHVQSSPIFKSNSC